MSSLLDLRENLKAIYQKYNIYIKIGLKFLFALLIFTMIGIEIGYDPRLKKFIVILALSVIGAVTPSAVTVLLAMVLSILNIFYISNILSLLVVLVVSILYFLFIRYTPKYGYVVVLIPFLFTLNMAYAVPILLGLLFTPITIIPTSCGVVIYYLIKLIKIAVTKQVNISVEDVLQLYTYVVEQLVANKHMIMTLIIFALVILVTYYIRRMKFDYSQEIAIISGGLTCLFGFLISDLALDVSEQIFGMILGTLVSIMIVYIIHMFNLALDYSGTEMVQFQDELYYYYVKAVPKMAITAPEKNIKRYLGRKEIKKDISSKQRQEDDNNSDDLHDIDIELNDIYLSDLPKKSDFEFDDKYEDE